MSEDREIVEETVKVTLTLTPEMYRFLEELRRSCGHISIQETIRYLIFKEKEQMVKKEEEQKKLNEAILITKRLIEDTYQKKLKNIEEYIVKELHDKLRRIEEKLMMAKNGEKEGKEN
mgnify:CR=1 FL=1